uniref:Uncharacterized protein n=1 Tax=Chionoecetes opilio bacilliform virus TaxID=1825681 RepID=A0A1Q3DL55_9VIRU|nr:hypothetical protein SCV_071 [Chionoecetes opilio bacilliform virus]
MVSWSSLAVTEFVIQFFIQSKPSGEEGGVDSTDSNDGMMSDDRMGVDGADPVGEAEPADIVDRRLISPIGPVALQDDE